MLEEILRAQGGVVTRRQALECGVTDEWIEALVAAGRWQRVFRRVYASFNGPLPRDCLLWAVLLRAGAGAMFSHETAAELFGLTDAVSHPIHVTVPAQRRVTAMPGVALHYRHGVGSLRSPTRVPARTRVEETVIDLTQTARRLDDALGWIARACGRRLTTADRLALAAARRGKLRWRTELTAALAEVADGCHSVLELRYLRGVERAHRLPGAQRQSPTTGAAGRIYDDVNYGPYGVVVELDGRTVHQDRWRDARRDNASTLMGRRVLRYGWSDVVDRPCLVAAQVAQVLRAAGWPGTPRRCGRHCVI